MKKILLTLTFLSVLLCNNAAIFQNQFTTNPPGTTLTGQIIAVNNDNQIYGIINANPDGGNVVLNGQRYIYSWYGTPIIDLGAEGITTININDNLGISRIAVDQDSLRIWDSTFTDSQLNFSSSLVDAIISVNNQPRIRFNNSNNGIYLNDAFGNNIMILTPGLTTWGNGIGGTSIASVNSNGVVTGIFVGDGSGLTNLPPVTNLYVTVQNNTGSTISNGFAVTVTSGNGALPRVTYAQATTNLNAMGYDCVGLASGDIANGGTGQVCILGTVGRVNTDNWVTGSTLWLSTNAGGITTNPPPANVAHVLVGVVARANANNGVVLVQPQQAVHFGDIGDATNIVRSIINSTTNTLPNGSVATNLTIYVPILKVWPDAVDVKGDSKSCEFRTNANTWSVHGGRANPLAISLWGPYTIANGIYTYTNGGPSVTVTNGGSWAVWFTNRLKLATGKNVDLDNSYAQSGLQLGSYLGTPYVGKGTKWIPPYTDPNGGDAMLYQATNGAPGRRWSLVYGGQNDLVSTNPMGVFTMLTNLWSAERSQGRIVIGATITITPTMFQNASFPDWTQLNVTGSNALVLNSLIMSNQFWCDAVVNVSGAVSNRVTTAGSSAWASGMITNWWDGTHPTDNEADFESSVWLSTLDTNVTFWVNVASYQQPSYQLSRWSKLNPDTYQTSRAITNNNATAFTNIGSVEVGDSMTIRVQTQSARLNVGNNNDSFMRFGGSLSDSTSAIVGMIGNGSWWFADSTTQDLMLYCQSGKQVCIGYGAGGAFNAPLRVVSNTSVVMTNALVKGAVTATNGVISYRTNAWTTAEISTNGFADWYSNSATMYRSVNKLGTITNVFLFSTP